MEEGKVVVTTRRSNGELAHFEFERATVILRQPFVVVYDGKKEQWFAVGTVIRVEIESA